MAKKIIQQQSEPEQIEPEGTQEETQETQELAARGMSPRIFTPLCHIGKV